MITPDDLRGFSRTWVVLPLILIGMVAGAFAQKISDSSLAKTTHDTQASDARYIFRCYFTLVFVIAPLIIVFLAAVPAHELKIKLSELEESPV